MVPDGSLGRVFFLGQSQADIDNFGNSAYTLQSLDINKFTPIATLTIPNVIGYPTHLIRWGTNGLAFTTITSPGSPQPSGAVYIIGSPFVNGN